MPERSFYVTEGHLRGHYGVQSLNFNVKSWYTPYGYFKPAQWAFSCSELPLTMHQLLQTSQFLIVDWHWLIKFLYKSLKSNCSARSPISCLLRFSQSGPNFWTRRFSHTVVEYKSDKLLHDRLFTVNFHVVSFYILYWCLLDGASPWSTLSANQSACLGIYLTETWCSPVFQSPKSQKLHPERHLWLQ